MVSNGEYGPLVLVLAYPSTLGTTDYTGCRDQCVRLKCSLYAFERSYENVGKLYSNSLVNSIIQLLQTASLFSSAQRDCQLGLAQQQCSHNPVSHTLLRYCKCRIRLMAHFIFHVAPELAVAKSLPPISRFPAWLLIMKVIRNEELC